MATEKRLIDAYALSEKIGNMKFEITHNRGGYKYCNEDEKSEWDKLDSFDSLVCDAPTVDAVEVVHGRWIPLAYYGYADGNPVWEEWECSECQEEHNGDEDTLTPYCPHCGAKMDGGNDDG